MISEVEKVKGLKFTVVLREEEGGLGKRYWRIFERPLKDT